MRIALFGATGMVGAGALIECLADPRVTEVISISRRSTGIANPKLREVLHGDFFDYHGIQSLFRHIDACFFCLGVSAAGLSEEEYRRMTYDLTLVAARAMVAVCPTMVFCYVTGKGTDSTETGRFMWARVKGRTENALFMLPFHGAYMFRPGFIQPMKGVRSSTAWYQAVYTITAPLMPLLRPFFWGAMTTSDTVGRALINVAANGYPKRILEVADINIAGR